MAVEIFHNGDDRARTGDLRLAKPPLSQLSYIPNLMGLGGFEPPTSRLSGARSNQLSYKPKSCLVPAWRGQSFYTIIIRDAIKVRLLTDRPGLCSRRIGIITCSLERR